jgi:hypothetical protein
MIDLDRVTGPKPFLLAFVVAGLISTALFASYTFLTDSGLLGLSGDVLVGLAYSSLVILFFAIPLFFLLMLLRIINLRMTLVSGFVIGAAVARIIDHWVDPLRETGVFAAIGTVSALGFWLTLKSFGLTPNNRVWTPPSSPDW